MSLYGYPREPEASGDEDPDSSVPLPRITSDPFTVPASVPHGEPPAPLLPPDPPGLSTYSLPSDSLPSGSFPSDPAGTGAHAYSAEPAWPSPYPHPSDPPGVTGFVPSQRRSTEAAQVQPTPTPAPEAQDFSWLRPPVPERPGFGVSPSMGQPAVPMGQEPAAADLNSIWVSPPAAPVVSTDKSGAGDRTAASPARQRARPPVDLLLDEPHIPPWDRRPLLVVIAATAVMILIGIASGLVTASFFEPGGNAAWRDGAPAPEPSEQPVPAPGDDTITLSAVGDMIIGSYNFGFPPNDGAGFYDAVRQALTADLVMGNLEQALTEPTGYSKCGPSSQSCYAYAAPPSYANVVRDAGFDLVTINNNHTNDYGPQGAVNTRAALDAAGVAHTGGNDQITYVEVEDVRVAVIGFSTYNWGANLNDVPHAVAITEQAAAEADLVVVQFHGGAEGADRNHVLPAGQNEYAYGENRGDLRTFTHAVVDAGADLVIGHGPHVMRGMEYYQGRLIAYSLGNFCGYRALNANGWNGVGGILKVTLHSDGTWESGQLVATEMVSPGTPSIDTDLRALGFVDGLSQQDFGASGARIDHATGAITVPG